MFPHLGEIALIMLIVIMIFGVSRLPQISEQLARGKRAFKKELRDPPKPSSPEPPPKKDHEASIAAGQGVEDAEVRPGQS